MLKKTCHRTRCLQRTHLIMVEWFRGSVTPIWPPLDHYICRSKETMENMRRAADSIDKIHTSGMFAVFPPSTAQSCCAPACLQRCNQTVLSCASLTQIAIAKEGWYRFCSCHQMRVLFFKCCGDGLWQKTDRWRLLCLHALRLSMRVDDRRGQRRFMRSGRCHLTPFLSDLEGRFAM